MTPKLPPFDPLKHTGCAWIHELGGCLHPHAPNPNHISCDDLKRQSKCPIGRKP